MATETFAVGDVVHLKSNPEVKMTVDFIYNERNATFTGYNSGDVECIWFAGNEQKKGSFHAQTLEKESSPR